MALSKQYLEVFILSNFSSCSLTRFPHELWGVREEKDNAENYWDRLYYLLGFFFLNIFFCLSTSHSALGLLAFC